MNAEDVAPRIIGRSAAIRKVKDLIARLAPVDIPVLIEGPTGSGKELVAQALHSMSGRRGSFVPVNLSALSSELFESAVFGHVKGAFTGAVGSIPGYLAEARDGTAFLDELGALPRSFQPKLLRSIETKTIRPVGGNSERFVTFRLVSATNVPLEELVAGGTLREDLAHRLEGIKIDVPALAARREDIGMIAEHLARTTRYAPFGVPMIESEAVRVLEQYDWPGNVRELRNVIESAVVLADSATITARDISEQLRSRREAYTPRPPANEREELVRALETYGRNITGVARHFRVHRVTIWRRMRRLGLLREGDCHTGADLARVTRELDEN